MADEKKKKPARKQVDTPVTGSSAQFNDTTQYNIWDHRRQKEFRTPREGRGVKTKSEYRCLPILDSGWTLGEAQDCKYCCLYFARGICHLGAQCEYLHRLPTAIDEAHHMTQPQYDIFGRDRMVEDTGGTKGVGSLARQVTTLYIYLGGASSIPQETLQHLVTKDFSEWGPIDDVKVVPAKAIAFVRYTMRSSAEFAKAAMHQQQLRGTPVDHVLDVRWANDDPNPASQLRVRKAQEEAMVKAYKESIEKLEPEVKRAKLYEIGLSASYEPGIASAAYPNTSHQYIDEGGVCRDGDEGEKKERGMMENRGLEEEDDINRYLLDDGDVSIEEYDCEYEVGVDDEDGGGEGTVIDGGDAVATNIEDPQKENNSSSQLLSLIGEYGSDKDE